MTGPTTAVRPCRAGNLAAIAASVPAPAILHERPAPRPFVPFFIAHGTVNLNRPAIAPGKVTEADLDALARSTREPGPQASKASRTVWHSSDVFLVIAVAVFSVLTVVHAIATHGA